MGHPLGAGLDLVGRLMRRINNAKCDFFVDAWMFRNAEYYFIHTTVRVKYITCFVGLYSHPTKLNRFVESNTALLNNF